jgi:cell filamentation protein
MRDFETKVLREEPAVPASRDDLIRHLATVHGELLFIHPFREGNGRAARLLTDLMAMKHGYDKLDYAPMKARFGEYVAAVQQAAAGNYAPMEGLIRAAFPS